MNLFLLYITESEPPIRSYSTHRRALHQRRLTHFLKENDNTEFVRRLTSKKFSSDETARKHSDVVIGNVTEEPKAAQTPHLQADYGILGISDDEDSAKWAAEEIKKISPKSDNKAKLPEQLQSTENSQKGTNSTQTPSSHTIANGTSMKDLTSSSVNETAGKNTSNVIIQSNNFPQGANKTLVNGLQLSNIIAKETKVASLIQNATLKIPSTNAQLIVQSYAADNHTSVAPADGINVHSGTPLNTTVTQTSSETTQNNKISNSTTGLDQKTKAIQANSEAFVNQPTSNELIFQGVAAKNKDKGDEKEKGPSLSVNFTSLRAGQSFDLQMPSSISTKGTYEDNHFHLQPQEILTLPENPSKQLQSNSNNTYFLNQTLDKVKAEEQTNGREPGTLLQQLNSDIVGARAEPLTSNVNLGSVFNGETFREETPAGRTFADKILEASSNQALPNGKETSQQSQTEVQQEESLARALNASSVSSIIYSANEAIFNTDKQVFAKKSAQERVDTKDKVHRNKRSNHLHRLTKINSKNGWSFKRKPRTRHPKATARQVINLGNHFLWFGGQGSADANGFPRHNTAVENPQYNVNGFVSNFLNSANENEIPSATKGYKALQNALTSMESNQEGQGDSALPYSTPSNKEMQDTDQGQTPASVVIQDEAGKSVYQGIVDILKLNKTKSNDNVSSIVGNQNHDSLVGHKEKDENKTETHPEGEPDSLSTTNINNQSAIPGMDNSLKPTTAQQVGGNKENQTETQNAEGVTGHADDTNSSVSKDLNQTQEVKVFTQAEQKPIPAQQMQSEFQSQQSPPSQAQPIDLQAPNSKQPSAIIKQLNTNSNEPETYHVILNDAGKKITNAKGHVTLIISGPTATQASMPAENTLLIPQTSTPGLSAENDNISSDENPLSALTEDQGSSVQSDQLSHSFTNASQSKTSQSSQTANNASLNVNKAHLPLSLLQEDAASALKISEEIEGQLNKGQPQVDMQKQDQKTTAGETSQNKATNADNTDSSMQQGHRFVKVGQDLTDGVDGLQMEEVSRPNIQEQQQQEKENLLIEPPGYLEGLEKSISEQSQDVPTLNIVLDPAKRIGGSLSVGGKILPVTSEKAEGDYAQAQKQQLDCHADPKNGKTTVTILTCQKKYSVPNTLSSEDEGYFGNQKMAGGPALQLDQVMNVLNDQVKATINREMKTESKDIQKMLTGMTVPSSTLMDADEASSRSEPPQRSSIGPDESYTSPPELEQHEPWEGRRHFHRKMHHFGLPHLFRFPDHLGFHRRRHFWGHHGHSANPFVVMAHKDSDEGFWDYQHNIFIPRNFNQEDDSDEEDDGERRLDREKPWTPWGHQGHRRGNWLMAHPPFHHPRFSPFRQHDLFHLRLPTIFGRSGPWRPRTFHKQVQGAKRTAVVHKTVRGDRDMCNPIIEGPSPPLKGEWEYLGKVLSSCPCRLTDSEW